MKGNYLRLTTDFASVSERVKKGELKWSHYINEDGIGCHYYEILK